MIGAGDAQKRDQGDLSGYEPATDVELLIWLHGVRRSDTKLYELDLVQGEQQVGYPKRPGRATQVACDDVIRRGRNRSQPRGPDYLCCRPGVPPDLLYDGLCDECGRRRGPDPQ